MMRPTRSATVLRAPQPPVHLRDLVECERMSVISILSLYLTEILDSQEYSLEEALEDFPLNYTQEVQELIEWFDEIQASPAFIMGWMMGALKFDIQG